MLDGAGYRCAKTVEVATVNGDHTAGPPPRLLAGPAQSSARRQANGYGSLESEGSADRRVKISGQIAPGAALVG